MNTKEILEYVEILATVKDKITKLEVENTLLKDENKYLKGLIEKYFVSKKE